MSTVTIAVREIHRGCCENTIRTMLSRMEGVRCAQPDYRTSRARVAYDEARVSEAWLREALAGIGLDPAVG